MNEPEDIQEVELRIVRLMLERAAVLMKVIGYPFFVEAAENAGVL